MEGGALEGGALEGRELEGGGGGGREMARRARECARGSAHLQRLQQGHEQRKRTLLLASVGGRWTALEGGGVRKRRRERG